MRPLLRTFPVVAALSSLGCGGMTMTPDAGMMPMGNAMNGQALYTSNGCAGCHGSEAAGTASGPNITGNAMAGIGGWTQAEFNRAIREGIGKNGKMFCQQMPRSPRLSDSQLADLFAFLKTKDSATVQRGPCP